MVGKILRRYITTLDAMLADGSQRNVRLSLLRKRSTGSSTASSS
jgi:hypothetical protein